MDSLIKISIKNPRKILIIKPSSLGDVVHSLPFLNAIKTCFHSSKMHWVIASGIEELLEGHPMIEKLWIINKDDWKKIRKAKGTISEIKTLFKYLKREKFDIAVDLQGLLRSGIITAATGAPVRIGFSEAREGSRLFYTHKIEGGKDIHAVDRYLKVAQFLGCDVSEVIFPFPLYKPTASLSSSCPEDYAVIIPGARWETKRWPSDKFGKLSSILPLKTIIVGSKGDIRTANEIVTRSNGKAISFAGNTNLKELIEIIKGARFVVSNDSGPMHIAAALGIPVFAIFGPTDPVRTGPYGKGHTVIKEVISCAPCFKKRCNDLKCMRGLSVKKVFGIIKAELRKSF